MIHYQSKIVREKIREMYVVKRSKSYAQKHFYYHQKNIDEPSMGNVFYHELIMQIMGIFQQCFYGHI